MNVIACYRSPGTTLSQRKWDVIISAVPVQGSSIFIGKFNARHGYWNGNIQDLKMLEARSEYESILRSKELNTFSSGVDGTSRFIPDVKLTSYNLPQSVLLINAWVKIISTRTEWPKKNICLGVSLSSSLWFNANSLPSSFL
ncbi:hypothetical protein QAD02_022397 [Eretmocerus hayati]|uniref:Uncharacterized protein n=1 Tax=Eretmocerus hayati TaxID=131215 RepID=A0ACC2PSZ2_9HYME|nr:hypothetical protein QAD02_022397 [Eretmocerus hayati]